MQARQRPRLAVQTESLVRDFGAAACKARRHLRRNVTTPRAAHDSESLSPCRRHREERPWGRDEPSDESVAMRLQLSALVVVSILVSALAACSASEFDEYMSAAEAAATAGDWLEAFDRYTDALELRPQDEGASAGAHQTATQLAGEVPLASISGEVRLLRWLESTGRLDDAVRLLDASVVKISSGSAPMGSPGGRADEQPQREVYLDAFAIDRYEVTNAQYARFIAATGEAAPPYWTDGTYPAATAMHPVVGVSWRQADTYCNSVGKRLPTEAEWERACRGPDSSDYPWGDEWLPDAANVTQHVLGSLDGAWAFLTSTTAPGLLPVGDPKAGVSGFGVCNLAGNASEWVADWYDANAYSILSDVNPIGAGPEWNHSLRGGAWLFRQDDAALLTDKSRCAFRNSSHMGADPRVGFRCASSTS